MKFKALTHDDVVEVSVRQADYGVAQVLLNGAVVLCFDSDGIMKYKAIYDEDRISLSKLGVQFQKTDSGSFEIKRE